MPRLSLSGETRGAPALNGATIAGEVGRRRSIAVISQHDSGKLALTGELALHGHAIDRAGMVSDWLEIQGARDISLTTAA